MKWISVKDRLPEEGIIVNVAIYYKNMGNNWKDWHIGVSHHNNKWWSTHFGPIDLDPLYITCGGKLLYWMPLSDPPEELKE